MLCESLCLYTSIIIVINIHIKYIYKYSIKYAKLYHVTINVLYDFINNLDN